MSHQWTKLAACQGADPAMFCPPAEGTGPWAREQRSQALALCATCPVVTPCLDEALRLNDVVTIRGGLTAGARGRLLKHHRAGTGPAEGEEQQIPDAVEGLTGA